ncbi:MAG: adenylyltransferase/cytidyltransferase family protein [Candidatus Acidiferrales bacterium]
MVRLQPSVVVNEESRDLGCVISQDELILRRAEWKRNGKRLVFASGAFDLLHPGHVRLIEQARSHGDVLVIGIESEANSRDRRGSKPGLSGLPITPSAERAESVAAMGAVDFAVEFDPNSSPPFAERLVPDAIIQGGNSASDKKVLQLAESSSSSAGKVIHIPLEPGHSTARLIERIKNLNA